jgi:hypothetical protein
LFYIKYLLNKNYFIYKMFSYKIFFNISDDDDDKRDSIMVKNKINIVVKIIERYYK